MFRRKEETATDSSNPAGASAQPTSPTGSAQDSAASSSQAPAQPSAPATQSASAYVPTARTAPAAAAADPARSAAPATSYRPTPIAEFNRGAARPADALRSAAPATSFAGSPEKAAAVKSNRRVLTVGNDILLKGEIATCDRLVIEGRVEAKLSEVHTVEIAECGSFKGTAEVEDAEISGVFEGDLVVRNRLVIYTSGEVRGNISYGEIEIERGGKLTGQIKTVAAGAAKGKAFEGAEKRKETAAA